MFFIYDNVFNVIIDLHWLKNNSSLEDLHLLALSFLLMCGMCISLFLIAFILFLVFFLFSRPAELQV